MAEKALRFDHGELKSPVKLPNGFWRFDGYIARAGIYEYLNTPKDEKLGYGKAGTIRRELRPEEEVGRDDVLAAFTGMSLTATHPKQEVTIDNARAYEVGTVVEQPRWDAATKRVAASIVVKDRATVDRIQKRDLNELSPGYKATIHKTPGADKRYAYPGNPEGKYDVVQRDIEPNHLALVKSARGGADLQVRLDAADDASVEYRADYGAKLTSVVDGHQHLFEPQSTWGGGDGTSGSTSYAVSEGADHGHEHAWVRNADGSITLAVAEGHTHTLLDENRYAAPRAQRTDGAAADSATAPKFAVGERVESLVNHMDGMKGMAGTVSIANAGSPPYYGVKFDDQKAMPGVHKWLSEDEVRAASTEKRSDRAMARMAMARMDVSQIDRSHEATESDVMAKESASGSMTTDEQIRLLKTQLDEATARANDLQSKLSTAETRADSADAIVQARNVRITELESTIAAGAQAAESAAIAEQAARADAAEEELAKLKASREGEIQKQAEVRAKAVVMMGAEFRCDGQDTREVQAAVIKKYAPEEDVSEAKSNAYIATRFDALYEDRMKTARSLANAGAVLATPVVREVRADAKDDDENLSHRDSWKKGLKKR